MKKKNLISKSLLFIKKNSFTMAVIAISLAIVIIGSFIFNWVGSLIFTVALDLGCFIILKIFKINPPGKEETKGESMSKKKTSIKGKKETKKTKKKKSIGKIILLAIFSVGILLILGFIGLVLLVISKAPEFDTTKLYNRQATILYDRDNEVFAKLGTERREIINYDQMPEVLVNAIVATEDSRFFQHNGFDLPRFLKASFGQLMGKDAGGASTLTMQISKQRFTSTKDEGIEGVLRKFTDIYLAVFKIEKKYTKKEILEIYANSFYLGAGAYGVEQAAQTYFNKNAKDLNLAEAAMIAGMFQAPDAYNPFENPEKTEARRKTVLYLMELHGYISHEERLVAEAMTVDTLIRKTSTNSNQYQSFIDTVVAEVKKLTGKDPYTTAMEIHTTMDKDMQNYVNSVMNGVNFTWANDVVQGAVSVLGTQSGEVVAIGAGRNYTKANSYNRANDMCRENAFVCRQIGSTAKPLYDYGPAIEYNNWSTATPLTDEPYTYSNGVRIGNWDGKYQGLLTMRTSLMGSRNIPAIKTFQQVDNAKIKEFVTGLGLTPEANDGVVHEAHAIGGYNGESPLTMSAAYAAYGNTGYYIEPHSLTSLKYRETGETYERQFIKKRAMSVETSYMVGDMLIDTSVSALGTYSSIGGATFAAKTGTTNFPSSTIKQFGLSSNAVNDLWVVGFNTDYTMAVWYGYDKLDKDHPEYVSIQGTTAGNTHKRLFQTFAKQFFKGKISLNKPNSVSVVGIEKESVPVALPSAYTPSNMITYELFKAGTEPTDVSDRYSQLANVTNLTATTNSNVVSLGWNSISTPSAIDPAALTEYFAKVYRSQNDRTNYYNKRLAYNAANIGVLGYSVYKKLDDGTLQYLGYTQSTNYTYTLLAGEANVKFVVKSEYSIFKSNASSGVEVTSNTSPVNP